MQHSISDDQYRRMLTRGTPVIVFDAWGKHPWHAKVIKYLGSSVITETERGIVITAPHWRIWLADDLFGPIEARRV